MGLTWGLSACGTAPTNTQFDGVSSQTTTPPLTRPTTMTPPSSRALGVNYNGEPDAIDLTQVQRTGADWIRVFIDYSDWKANPHQFSAGFQKLHQAHSLYKLVVNLKFNFKDKPLPTDIDGYLDPLSQLVPQLYGDCDILVIGNEPFIESLKTERLAGPGGTPSKVTTFYIKAAFKVKSIKDALLAQGLSDVPLYLGAYDSIWIPEPWQNNARDLLQFTHDTPWLSGADLHLHQEQDGDITAAFDFVEPLLRQDQKILVTEFSQVNYYLTYTNSTTIPASFAARYKRNPDWKVWEYLNWTLTHPVAIQEWTDLLKESPWFENSKGYLTSAWETFLKRPKFLLATYGIDQTAAPPFQQQTQPWILNAILVTQTVQKDPTGNPPFNYAVGEQFTAIQRAMTK